MKHLKIVFVIVAAVGFAPCGLNRAMAEPPGLSRAREQLQTLAETCRARGMELEARLTESRFLDDEPYTLGIPTLPSVPLESLPDDATDAQRGWFDRLKTLRREGADASLATARRLAQEGKGYAAFESANQGLFFDPDHPELRQLFGWRLRDGVWRTEWESEQLDRNRIDHPRFGWIDERNIADYESGRFEKTKKIVTRTEHFEIETTLSLPKAVEVGRFLEEFHRLWDSLFQPLTATEKETATAIRTGRFPPRKRHRVVLLANRREYLDTIMKIDPSGIVSSGGYLPSEEAIFVYPSDDPNDSQLETMLRHEVTHQLFAEAPLVRKANGRRKRLAAGEASNYALLEGIATYMETLSISNRGITVGGFASDRLLRATERCNEPNGLRPLAELMALGKWSFQHDPQLPMLYTESCAMAHFLIHADGGKYRSAFFDLIAAVYQNADEPDGLIRRLGISWPELDQQFTGYLLQLF